MGVEQLYFVIGFLLGTLLTGCLVIFVYALWHEFFVSERQLRKSQLEEPHDREKS